MIHRFTFSRLLKICLFLSFLINQSLSAQEYGALKGTVTDRNTGEKLPGANIIIKGANIGAACDLDGKFLIRNIPSGRQTVEVSYMGYTSQSLEVDIPQGKTLAQDFHLVLTTLEGETVLVTAQAQGQLQAINQQLTSNKIVSVVSESRIQEL